MTRGVPLSLGDVTQWSILDQTQYRASLEGLQNSACLFNLGCPHASLLSRGRLSVTPQTVARRAPPSMGFSRRDYCSGLPFPPPGDLPNPGIEPGSSGTAGGFFATAASGRPLELTLRARLWRSSPLISTRSVTWIFQRRLTEKHPPVTAHAGQGAGRKSCS